jgi:hypothetical protein
MLPLQHMAFSIPPHIDSKDLSEDAFVLFLPTNTKDGSLITNAKDYNITSGPFIFPGHQAGINFDHQFGTVEIIWKAKQNKHCI